MNKDLSAIARKAKKQGFTVEYARNGHLIWRNPDGRKIQTSSTPNTTTKLLLDIKKDLRKIGLEI